MSVFESNRAGFQHRYEVTEEGLNYNAGTKTKLSIRWEDFTRLTPGRAQSICFVSANQRHKIVIWLEPKEMERFLEQAFSAWNKKSPGAAKKAAFDYGSQSKAMGWVWIAVGLLFPGMLALMLLEDGYTTRKCDRLLEQPQMTQGELIKVKKGRRGAFEWKVKFKTDAGHEVTGTRPVFTLHDETGKPTSGIPIVYSPQDKECWDISMSTTQSTINWKQRRFSAWIALSFGWSFAILTGLCVAFGLSKVRLEKPYSPFVQKIAATLS